MPDTIKINRAPVLTLWATVVTERMGYDEDEALSLGKAVAGLNAQAKGRSLGIYRAKPAPEGGPPKKRGLGEEFWVEVCGRPVPAKNTKDGVRAVVKDKPIDPASAKTYLEGKFGDSYAAVPKAFKPDELAKIAFQLYEEFRPEVEPGKRGWGQAGELSIEKIKSLAK
jgi:hypothetical protein